MLKKILFAIVSAPFILSACGETSAPEDKASIHYTLASDNAKGTTKRTVEVFLKERVSEKDLEQFANEIKEQEQKSFDRTFISWRIDGEDDERWALTNFDPSFTVKLFGLTAEEHTDLVNLTSEIDGELLGSWIESGLGASSHKVVGYKKNGKVYFDELYVNGARKVHEYNEQEHDGQTRYKAKGDEVLYLVINKDGRLESWTETSKFNSLKPA